ncbi:polysaccharide pyruvyl transferase family protein [Microbacterium sp. zg-Y818]|uniref:polysaccharide pyruvyl transferase family protein n=1 Tax=unclassified Microbacterium TaxID=2609290 RepID=UPI00214BB0E5|nr:MULTISPECIES: polysaccharide pyruvyl transferase family protein [unclassified Microbacterium]MCR2801913.1 polysaccharide pyruvyl transferase family protein [Microbacterium sp. zg.Y818]WIM22830.1 polysaccharide pyruvyl transferase family protein [Microbacterium sp. zg-Y818]
MAQPSDPDAMHIRRVAESVHSGISNALAGASSVALLDFPSHMNVGDSMIWAGERTALRQLGVRVRYVADIARYDRVALERAHPEGPILLHGGGNFGDLWPEFQSFRLRVLADFPDRDVVQLPQSILFEDEKMGRTTNDAIRQHGRFTLMCRDHDSMERARRFLPQASAVFVPDAAVCWEPASRAKPGGKPVVLLRRDHEAQQGMGDVESACRILFQDAQYVDWGLKGFAKLAWKTIRIPGRLAKKWPSIGRVAVGRKMLMFSYEAMARLNLRAGRDLFDGASFIVTDRLHAHVLATLLRVPHLVVDNSYGKVSAVAGGTTLTATVAEFAGTSEAAVRALHERPAFPMVSSQ